MTFSLPIDPTEVRALLEDKYGNPGSCDMTPYERVDAAIRRQPPDRVPFDFWAVPETIQKMKDYLRVETEEELLRLLGVDCRWVEPVYIGPPLEVLEDGTFYDANGSHRRVVSNAYSSYEEYASYPLADCKTADQVRSWGRWARTEYFDWDGLAVKIETLQTPVPYHLTGWVGGIFESAWSLYGLDRFLTDLIEAPEVPCAIMDGFTDLFIANFENMMRVAKGKIDLVYTYDDVAMQNGLLMSPRMWRKYVLPRHQRLNRMIKDYGVHIMYHSCGAIYPLVRELIDEMHIDVLNPLQPRAKGMDMQRLKDEFGGEIAFHGGIDLQHTLPYGSQQDVVDEVEQRCRVLGDGGGYICTSAHYIQADVPVENILAMYLAPREMK
jgi:uroporphyrinogen decarboxylase